MSRRAWILCLIIPLAGFAVPARGDVVISFATTPVAVGGTGTVDVYLTSNAPDMINGYGFQVQLSNLGLDGTQLQFTPNEDLSYVNNPDYVFAGNSYNLVGSTTSSMTGYPNDTFGAVDSTLNNNSSPVTLTPGTPYLLASLTVTTIPAPPGGAAPMPGDSFSISLVPTSGDGSALGSSNTLFNNYDYSGNNGEISATPFTSTSGTINIVASAVPEPASIVSGLAAMLSLLGVHGVRRARRRVTRSA